MQVATMPSTFRGLPLSASEPSSSRSKCRFNAVRIRLAASVLGDIGRTYLNIGRKRRKVLWVFTHSRANRSEYGSTNEPPLNLRRDWLL